MSYLKTVVLAGFISRQTIFLLILFAAVALPLFIQGRAYNRACASYVTKYENPVGFDPCHIWREPSPGEKTLAVEGFVFFVGFGGSLFIDLYWAIRRHTKRNSEIVMR